MPQVLLALDRDDTLEAYALAEQLEEIDPDNEILATLWSKMSHTWTIESDHPGAAVSIVTYHDESGAWQELGTTPLEARIPWMPFRLRFDLGGHQSSEIARASEYFMTNRFNLEIEVRLHPIDAPDSDMVYVAAKGSFDMPVTGFAPLSQATQIPEFFIDKTEVTNRQFKEFIDAGGYQDPQWWKYPFEEDEKTLPFEEAMMQFTDQVGRPGPANWELGDYEDGKDNYPVGGISWYEAAAYAEFKGKTLPTAFHFAAALYMESEGLGPLAPDIKKRSNLHSGAPAPVGQHRGIGTSGALDMAGNQREWCFNEGPTGRFTMGGSWEDQPYLMLQAVPRSAWNRSLANGFPCAKYLEEDLPPRALFAAIQYKETDYLTGTSYT